MIDKDLFEEISLLDTEQINPLSVEIDSISTLEILEIINKEDQKVALAVKNELPFIAQAVDMITKAFLSGGRLFYFGAGTSGRLGVVDASECPPTFGVSSEMVQGFIAGGSPAMFKAQEGAEDSESNAERYFTENNICSNDIICGIAASGRTPFVIGALKIAKEKSIPRIMITTIRREKAKKLIELSDVVICPFVGPEVIAGSTRMKSGTAQKLVLNMLTTASMVKIGKTYNNIMVDLQLTNKKLIERAKKIVISIADVDYETATGLLQQANGNVKTALFMALTGVNINEAIAALSASNGRIKDAINNIKQIGKR